jgi:hypothetical protein
MLQFLKKKYRGLKMKFRTLKILRARRNARKRKQTTERAGTGFDNWPSIGALLLVGCENKHKIGIS